MKTIKLKICRGKKSQLVFLCQVVTNPCCGLAVIFCGFISYLIGRETINIPEIFSGVHGSTGKTVKVKLRVFLTDSSVVIAKKSTTIGSPMTGRSCDTNRELKQRRF